VAGDAVHVTYTANRTDIIYRRFGSAGSQ
jgi:predicted neuraminidase